MSTDDIATYLNDHLAGSVSALELLDHLAEKAPDPARKTFFKSLRIDIAEDQDTLKSMLQQVAGSESGLRKAAAWLTEKVSRARFAFDDSGGGELAQLEALEALALGIQGKLGLWRALGPLAGRVPSWRGIDFGRLERRAQDQHGRVEATRIDAARATLEAPDR